MQNQPVLSRNPVRVFHRPQQRMRVRRMRHHLVLYRGIDRDPLAGSTVQCAARRSQANGLGQQQFQLARPDPGPASRSSMSYHTPACGGSTPRRRSTGNRGSPPPVRTPPDPIGLVCA